MRVLADTLQTASNLVKVPQDRVTSKRNRCNLQGLPLSFRLRLEMGVPKVSFHLKF